MLKVLSYYRLHWISTRDCCCSVLLLPPFSQNTRFPANLVVQILLCRIYCFTDIMRTMFRRGIFQPIFSRRLSAPCPGNRRSYSPHEMRFRMYPRSFPFAMLNIMDYGKRFLKVTEFEDTYFHNCVQVESNGLIDPYLAVGEGLSSL